MRIVHIIDNLYRAGGAQKMELLFAQLACANGIDLTVVSLEDDRPHATIKAELAQAGARVQVFSAKTLLDPARLWRLAQFLRRQKFDVAHTNLTYANIVGVLAARLAGIPVIGGLRNAGARPDRHQQTRHRLETFTLRRLAAAIMAVGHTTAQAHQSRLGERPIHVVQNCVVLPRLPAAAERAAMRAELLDDPDRPLILSVGRLAEQKGYPDLLAAVARLRSTHPAAMLLIAGEGRLRPALEAQIVEQRLAGHVRLLGMRRDVPRLLSAADLFVSSSHWEGLPNAVLEAMAAGLPIVATSVSDTPRVVVDGSGLLVPPKNPDALAAAIDTLLNNPTRMRVMGA
ncbi:MAG: glycosyltransferase, partial [Chloroflexi bacterium]